MNAWLNSAVTWSGLIHVVAAWIIIKWIFQMIGWLASRAAYAAAVERVMSGGPEGEAELKKFLEHIGFRGTVHEVKITNDKGHNAPPPGEVN